jgi:phosphoglycerate dehydrogenase-like enzyme
MPLTDAVLSPAGTKAGTERILFAMSDSERELFFPGFSEDLIPFQSLEAFTPKPGELAEWEQVLRTYSPTIIVSSWSTPMIPESHINRADSELRYVCHTGGTVRKLVSRSLLERGILVTNWGSLASMPVAEHALLLMLAALRKLGAWRPLIDMPTWSNNSKRLKTRSLHGQRVGIHGFGKIARELLVLLRPFEVSFSAYSANVPPQLMRKENVKPCSSLEELFSSSDILVECEALTPETAQSVTKQVLELLPQDAIFVNIGRAQVVDEAALIRLATKGRIQLALDVFAQEPLPPDSPLLSIPNAILSPHIAGPTLDVYPRCGMHALENVRAYLAGEPVDSIITLEIYDRST